MSGKVEVPQRLPENTIKRVGNPHSQDSRDRQSFKMGGVRAIAYPLVLRFGTVGEVSQISGIEAKKVEALRDHLRNRGGLRFPTPEETIQARRRAQLLRERSRTPGQEKSLLFAQGLQKKGLFERDLSYWKNLHTLYEESGRKIPESFFDRLRLEVFLRGITEAEENGDYGLLDNYNYIGREIDPEWFNESLREEEEFLMEKPRFSLAFPFKDYCPEVKEVIKAISLLKVSKEMQAAFFTYWVHFIINGSIEDTAGQLGISAEQVLKQIHDSLARQGTEEEWQKCLKML